jgi:ribosomal protein S18 acetylase RimI-like enzyme
MSLIAITQVPLHQVSTRQLTSLRLKAQQMDPYVLSEGRSGEAGQLIAEAFSPAPGAVFWCPDETRRALIFPPFFAAITRLTMCQGVVIALGDPLQAVALWLSPDRRDPSGEETSASGLIAANALMDAGELQRRRTLDSHFDKAHERIMHEPHWYLSFLAVGVKVQGQGTGSVLMRYSLDYLDPPGLPCYLNSTDERNLAFYDRIGFRIMEHGIVPGSNVRTWSMRRN